MCMVHYQYMCRAHDYEEARLKTLDIEAPYKRSFIETMKTKYRENLTLDLLGILEGKLAASNEGDFLRFCSQYGLYCLLESELMERDDSPRAPLGLERTLLYLKEAAPLPKIYSLLMLDELACELLSALTPDQLAQALHLDEEGNVHELLALSEEVFNEVLQALTPADVIRVLFSKKEEVPLIDSLLSGDNELGASFKKFLLSAKGLDHLLQPSSSPLATHGMFNEAESKALMMRFKESLLDGTKKLTPAERAEIEKNHEIQKIIEIIARVKGVTPDALYNEVCGSHSGPSI